MARRLVTPSVTLAIIVMLGAIASPSASAQGRGYDCAHGPDHYRVRNVASHDHLNIRSGPSVGFQIIGKIPAQGTGVKCLGPCRGQWCLIRWRKTTGWSNMRYLGE